MWDPVTPELAQAIIQERREAARSIYAAPGRARPRQAGFLRRFMAACLASLAAHIHLEAAHSAIATPECRQRRAESA